MAFVQHVGMAPGEINWSHATDHVWREVLDLARLKGKLRPMLARICEVSPGVSPRLEELLVDQPVVAPAAGDAPGDWTGFDPNGIEERLIVEDFDSLLNIAFLERGLEVARSVCRFYCVMAGDRSHGTGFRIGPDLLLTNHHVLHHWSKGHVAATHVEAWFNYELDWRLQYRRHTSVVCDPTTIVGEKAHDWAVVRTMAPIPDSFPVLLLSTPDAALKINDRVFIIQHPEGQPKMIGLDHNLVRHVDDDILQYWTDTKVGSSGSPVFNAGWQIVGLHHRAVRIERGDHRPEWRNQGRNIVKIQERMAALGVVA